MMKLSESIKAQIKSAALKSIKDLKLEKATNLHLHDAILLAGEKLKAKDVEISLERDSAFVFVDLAPSQNWVHPCEYHLYDAHTGAFYQKAKAVLPPSKWMADVENHSNAFHAPVAMPDTKNRRVSWNRRSVPIVKNALSNAPGERYAILFAGHANNRHTNDLEFLYRTLVDVYGYNSANIHVLNHDGTLNYFGFPKPIGNWPGDNTAYRMTVTGQGTRAGFQNAFNTIAGQIRPEDSLLIHTNNHGGGPGDGVTDYCMFVYDAAGDWVPYYVNDFISDLSVLPTFDTLMVMMEQCRAGGFINPIINNSPAKWTHVASAVVAGDYSDGGANFDPFAEDWIAAMNGSYPDGTGLLQVADANGDGRISALEAFHYADAVVQGGDSPIADDSPDGCGAYIYLGLPAHDLYLRDNLEDHGLEPLIDGGISCSPDIVVFNQELLDPETTLGTPAAQQSDTLGHTVEAGQDNFIYLRVQNRGTQPTSGTVQLFWANPSILPTPASWHEITDPAHPFVVPVVNPKEMKIVGPIVWEKAKIPGTGHYCFVGLINSGFDPAPDPATIHTIDDYYNFIRQSNNATWRNFDVIDVFKNSLTNVSFTIQGWPKIKIAADLLIDLTQLPEKAQVTLRVLKRISKAATLENASLKEETSTYQKFRLIPGKKAYLHGVDLKTSDVNQGTLEVITPEQVPDGNYRFSVAEIVDGKEMGRITRMLSVGQYPFLANSRTKEVHEANCEWAQKTSRKNKVAYKTLDQALKHGYDGCQFCLPEYNHG